MTMKPTKLVLLMALSSLLCACNGFFDKDNTPEPAKLVKFKQEAKPNELWSRGTNSGVGMEYLKLVPAITSDTIYTAAHNGVITASNKSNGKIRWNMGTGMNITSGPTASGDLLFVGAHDGTILALKQSDGTSVWHTQVSTEVLAPPAAAHGVVLVKAIDGELTALSEKDGHLLWRYHQSEPTLILRGASTPKMLQNSAVVGFANGNLTKVTLDDGSMQWQKTVAIPQGVFAIQRMVDIDADPVIYGNRVYAATYQGRISALDLATGNEIWNHDLSSYTGIAADDAKVYVTDANSYVWAIDAKTGNVAWRQIDLYARNTTGPAVYGNYIVVGDAEGYLHWLSKEDGHFVARTRASTGILATPVVENNTIYVLSRNGHLAAYTL